MRCPKCGAGESVVIESREKKNTVRRRRQCARCRERYSTREIPAETYEALCRLGMAMRAVLKEGNELEL